MATWSHRRKSIYLGLLVSLLVIFIGVPGFFSFYEAPTCTDGKENGSETGVDCGGACTKLCQSSFIKIPAPRWVRFKSVGSNVYNAAAYLVNPNPNATAKIPFVIEFLDDNGIILAKSEGKVTMPPSRNTLAFVAGVTLSKEPKRAIFKFRNEPNWDVSNDDVRMLETVNKDYVEDDTSSALTVTFRNNGIEEIENVTVFAILQDSSGNAIDFSKTLLDYIGPGESVIAPFTWPMTHDGHVVSIEVLPVAE